MTEIVQLAFGLGNLLLARWLAVQGLSGQASTEDYPDVVAKWCAFIDGPRGRGGDVLGGSADGSRAVNGVRRLRPLGRDGRDRDQRRDGYQRPPQVLSRR